MEEKYELALNSLESSIVNYIQTLLVRSGFFDTSERHLDSQIFRSFIDIILVRIAEEVEKLRDKFPMGGYYEKIYFENLLQEENKSRDPRMDIALKMFESEYPQSLLYYMQHARFNDSEIHENHDSFFKFYSKAFLLLCNKFRPEKCEISSNNVLCSQKRNSRLDFDGQLTSALITKLIAKTKRHHLYLLEKNSKKFVLKYLKANNPTVKDIEQLDTELFLTNQLQHPAIRTATRRTTFEGKEAILLDWINGLSLSKLNKLSVAKFLIIAREIVSAVMIIHKNQFIHSSLSCDHIIIDEQSETIKLIGLSSATAFTSKKRYVSIQDLKEKDIRYIAPEQTGRNNRDVDYRADFYSLGVIFYKLLAGSHPFESSCVNELLNLHLIRNIKPLIEVDKRIPKPLSDLVSTLMEKNAESRYQSASGIMHDIDLMISEHSSNPFLDSLCLAQHDRSDILLIPQKLFGRSEEYEALVNIIESVHSTRSFEFIFIEGEAGAGKSKLVFELQKYIIELDGSFIHGKFDMEPKPYQALIEAITGYFDSVLLQSETTINDHKKKIQSAMGEEGKLLTDMIRNFHLIIGQQNLPSDLYGQEAKNRFNHVLTKLLKTICSFGFIVLLIEDLHAIDYDSMIFLTSFISDKTINNLALIGTFRGNEGNKNPFFTKLMDFKNGLNRRQSILVLKSLNHNTVNEIVSATLHTPPFDTYSLTTLIYEKTKGNCFFVNEMIRTLYNQRLIFFSSDIGQWRWDEKLLMRHDLSANVLDILRKNLSAFDRITQQVFKIASLLGSPFSLSALSVVIESNGAIKKALSSGMIVQIEGYGRFAHDMIQQAAYSLLPSKLNKLMYYVGKKLWKSLSNEEIEQNIFSIVKLLQYSPDIVEEEEERVKLASLFLTAAKISIGFTAFREAVKIMRIGIKILGPNCWRNQFALSHKLYNEAATAAYCSGSQSEMNNLILEISNNATSVMHEVHSYHLRIKFDNDNRKYEDAIKKGICILDKLGVTFDQSKSDEEMYLEIQRTKTLLYREHFRSADDFRVMVDEKYLSIMMTLSDIITSCYLYSPRLLMLVSSKMVQLSFTHGISKYSSIGFYSFGVVLSSISDDASYDFGTLGLILLQETKAKEFFPAITAGFHAIIKIYFFSIHSCIDPLLKSYRVAVEVGNVDMAVISANSYCYYCLHSGKNLIKSLKDFQEFFDLLKVKNSVFLSTYQIAISLIGKETANIMNLPGKIFDFDAYGKERKIVSGDIPRTLFNCMFISYLFHDYFRAFSFGETCQPFLKFIKGTSYAHISYLFYYGLVSLAVARKREEKNQYFENAQNSLSELMMISKKVPNNCTNKIHLLQAELATFESKKDVALLHYEESISHSKMNEFLHEEALANELCGVFLETSDHLSSTKLLERSCSCYRKWGATAKVNQILTLHKSISIPKSEKIPFSEISKSINESSSTSISQITEISSFTFDDKSTRNKRVRFI